MKKTMKVDLRKKKLSNGGYSLYLAWWDPNLKHNVSRGPKKGQVVTGKWVYEFLGLHLLKNDKLRNDETLRLAEEIRARKYLNISNGNSLDDDRKKASFIKYFKKLQIERSKKNSRQWTNALRYLKKFLSEYQYSENVTFEEVDRQFVRKFKEFLLNQKALNQNTARGYFVKLRAALNEAVRDELIESSPAKNVRNIDHLDTEIKYLTVDEIKRLEDTPCSDEEVKKIFLFCCNTGLRKNDAFTLTWDSFSKSIINGNIRFKLTFRQEKTGDIVTQYLNKNAIRILNIENIDIKEMSGQRVFKLRNHSQIDRALKVWDARAGINKNLHFHMSRHTFATVSLQNNTKLYTVSKLLGHKTLAATEGYAKVVDQAKIEASDNFPEIG
jgi:integrase